MEINIPHKGLSLRHEKTPYMHQHTKIYEYIVIGFGLFNEFIKI